MSIARALFPAPLFFLAVMVLGNCGTGTDQRFVAQTVEAAAMRLYWKDSTGQRIGSLGRLKNYVAAKGQQLRFAMNGGMYAPDHAPQGLYIERGQTLHPLDTSAGNGNFYLKPNGVFYITRSGRAGISSTTAYQPDSTPYFATQSGPLLLWNDTLHPAIRKGSSNKQIRNAVGLLPNNQLLFVQSKVKVSFYEMAAYFRSRGCTTALYLDGYVSRTYAPEQHWIQTDGDFGVIIGVVTDP